MSKSFNAVSCCNFSNATRFIGSLVFPFRQMGILYGNHNKKQRIGKKQKNNYIKIFEALYKTLSPPYFNQQKPITLFPY